ncbi:MAG: thioredoxin [bacterium]|nr:thioredoxin [bacterium]
MKIEITDDNFAEEVLKSSVPILVDFWAPWCGPCRAMNPIIEALADEMDASQIKIGAMNVDESGETAQKFGIMSIPTFIIFKDGQEVERIGGSLEKDALKAKMLKHVA